MLQLRKEHKTLVYGDYEEYMMESESVFLYKRWDEDGCYFILLNFTDQQQSIKSIEIQCLCSRIYRFLLGRTISKSHSTVEA